MISSKDVTISINPQDALPTVSTERCENIHLYFYEPQAMKSIYTAKCTNIVVHLQPPRKAEHVLEIPAPEESNDQFVSEFRYGKIVTEKVIRGM